MFYDETNNALPVISACGSCGDQGIRGGWVYRP
jgi:hypothetical protein